MQTIDATKESGDERSPMIAATVLISITLLGSLANSVLQAAGCPTVSLDPPQLRVESSTPSPLARRRRALSERVNIKIRGCYISF